MTMATIGRLMKNRDMAQRFSSEQFLGFATVLLTLKQVAPDIYADLLPIKFSR